MEVGFWARLSLGAVPGEDDIEGVARARRGAARARPDVARSEARLGPQRPLPRTATDADDSLGEDGGAEVRPDPRGCVDHDWYSQRGTAAVAEVVEAYMRRGAVESYELGYSHCRFGCTLRSVPDSSKRELPRAVRASSSDGDTASSGRLQSPAIAACDCDAPGDRVRGGGSSEGGQDQEALDPREMGCCTQTDGVYIWPEGTPHYMLRHHGAWGADTINCTWCSGGACTGACVATCTVQCVAAIGTRAGLKALALVWHARVHTRADVLMLSVHHVCVCFSPCATS